MNEIPSIWRTELWHPKFVHFPIVCLLLATLTGIAAFLISKRYPAKVYLRFTMSFLLWCGVIFFWITFYTGKLAYSVEVRKICDPTVLKDHLLWANISGIIFSLAMLLDIFRKIWATRIFQWLMPVIVILMIVGTICISYDAHLGASLVYQQGAGVHKPPDGCPGF